MSAFIPVTGSDFNFVRDGLQCWLTYDDEEQSLNLIIQKSAGSSQYDRPLTLQTSFLGTTAQAAFAAFIVDANKKLRERFGGGVAPIESEPAGGWEWIQWVIKPSNQQLTDDADGVGLKRK